MTIPVMLQASLKQCLNDAYTMLKPDSYAKRPYLVTVAASR